MQPPDSTPEQSSLTPKTDNLTLAATWRTCNIPVKVVLEGEAIHFEAAISPDQAQAILAGDEYALCRKYHAELRRLRREMDVARLAVRRDTFERGR